MSAVMAMLSGHTRPEHCSEIILLKQPGHQGQLHVVAVIMIRHNSQMSTTRSHLSEWLASAGHLLVVENVLL